jgi:Ankyrin repeats (3 copies)
MGRILRHRDHPNGSSTALHLAADGCQSDIIRLLLAKKAKVDAMSLKGTPLCLAAIYGDVTTIKVLLDAGANPNLQAPHIQCTPLCTAAYNGYPEAVKLFLGCQILC